MIPKNDKRDALNLLIYEYLMKNNFGNTASIFKEESKITEFKLSDTEPSLTSLYHIFMETFEVRSGQIAVPDTLNRIEGIMCKLENDKKRYARMKNFSKARTSPLTRKSSEFRSHPFNPRSASADALGSPYDPRGPQSPVLDKYDPYHSIANPGGMPHFPGPVSGGTKHYPNPNILTEIKRIDLGISAIVLSHFCPINNIVITFSTDGRIYFYNLATNEIEYDFVIQGRTVKDLKAIEVGKVVYFAYAVNEFTVNLCKYEYMKKDDIKLFDFDLPIKSFCINDEFLYVLDDNGIKAHTFMGVCVGSAKIPNIQAIECFGKSLIIIDSSKIAEFDLNKNVESNFIARGPYLCFKVKGDMAFVISKDVIQAIDFKNRAIVASVKCSLPCKDIAMYYSSIAVSTQSELFYANQVIPLKSPIEVSQFNCLNSRGLLVISTDGLIILYSKIQAFE